MKCIINGDLTKKKISDENSNLLTINNVGKKNIGMYDVVISNDCKTVISDPAELRIISDGPPPKINVQPHSKTVGLEDNIMLKVEAEGQKPLHYQWLFNNKELQGENNSTLNIEKFSVDNKGKYYVIVSNQCGSISSKTVWISLPPPPIRKDPKITLDTRVLSFSKILISTEKTKPLKISNIGQGKLKLRKLLLEGDKSFELVGNLNLPQIVEVDKEINLLIKFSPVINEISNAKLIIESNDPERSKIVVEISGEGYASKSADEYHLACEEAIKKGNYNSAITNYTKLLNIDPRQPKAYYMRGIAYYNMDQLNYAIKDFEIFISKYINEMAGDIELYQCKAYFYTALCYSKLYQDNKQESYRQNALKRWSYLRQSCSSFISDNQKQVEYWENYLK